MSSLGGSDLLKKYQIPVPNSFFAQNFSDAKILFENRKIKFPVILKWEAKNIIHKTDYGLVVSNIFNDEQLSEAFEVLNSNALKNKVQLEKIQIEELIMGGVEVFIGGKRDSSLGNILTVGSGGIFTEIYKDSFSNLMSEDPEIIFGYLEKTKIFKILNGFRNLPRKDVGFLVEVIISLKKMFDDNGHISEFDLNPFIVLEKGGFAVDFNFIEKDPELKFVPQKNRRKISQDIFDCDSIAIVGASENKKKVGSAVFNNTLEQKRYKIIPVNNKREFILGEKTFPSVVAIPEDFNIGVCVVCVPAKNVGEILRECCEKKIKLVVIISAGFGEYSESGKLLEKELREIVSGTETRIMGPNCMGMMASKYGLNLNFATKKIKSGNISLISQSGGIFSVVTNSVNENFQNPKMGFSFVFSIGNQCDLDLIDFFDFVLEDDATKVVILYVEGMENAKEFFDFYKNKKRAKPVILIQTGGAKKSNDMALTHTGSLFLNYEVSKNICESLGIITTSSITDAISMASFFSQQEIYCFQNPVVLSNSGGISIMINDYLENRGTFLPCLSGKVNEILTVLFPQINCRVNPIDILGDTDIDRLKKILEALNEDKNLDCVIFIGVMLSLFQMSVDDIIMLKKSCSKKFIICLLNWEGKENDFAKLASEDIFIFTSLESFLPVLLVLLKMQNEKFKKK
ncbi:MAG: acetate--CoA ligase family protein [Cytophagales bacterium]|jgi:acyl-CoA synthetase (NDP forming)|nr:acetate--CoA ligase family protein [Cytophagales bacterium]